MAVQTAASVLNLGPMGDCVLKRFRFTSVADTDTFVSGLTGITAFWTHDNSNPTTQASVGCAATVSSGTFTFYPAEDSKAVDLFVLVRS